MVRNRFLSLLALAVAFSVLASACAPAAAPTPTAAPTSVPTLAPTLAPTLTAVPTPVPTVAPTPTAAPTAAPTVVPSPTAIALSDGLGRSVTLAAPARRIVSLAPSNTEILFAIGAGSQLVARDDFSDYPAAAKSVASIGSLYPKVNAEGVVALQPDLVLAAGVTSPDDVKTLTGLGLTVYATKKAATLDDIFHDILAVGQLAGHAAEAEKLVTDLQARAKAVTDKLNGVAPKPLVFYEIDATDPTKPWTAGPGSFIDQLITTAGATNAGSAGSSDYFQISLEQLVAANPDIIVLGSATFGGQTPAIVAKRAGWKNIKAVKSGAVYPFDDNLVSRPGPRVVDGLEALAKLIHPELFK